MKKGMVKTNFGAGSGLILTYDMVMSNLPFLHFSLKC